MQVIEPKFKIIFLEEALRFLEIINQHASDKIIYNIDKARIVNDPKLFKKLRDDIWEFRTDYSGLQYRLLAFWDKAENVNTLVVATHGLIKKTDKIPDKEIGKAIAIRKKYFNA